MTPKLALTILGAWSMASLGAAEPNPDWLVLPESYKADIREDKGKKELVLSNGLVQRTIVLAPNAATVGLDNLSAGEFLLRAVGPEARIKIDGTDYAIGGLTGQPVKNYLKAAWITTLRDDPNAYHFSGWKSGSIEARFPWKKRSEWLSSDRPWPPPGKHAVLTFVPPAQPRRELAGPIRFQERFDGKLDAGWSVHISKQHERSSFANEGKPGEICALPDCCVFAERSWPKDGTSVEVILDAGDDRKSNSWGPGFALVSEDRTVSFVVRPSSGQFEIDDPENGEQLAGVFDRSKSARLRARIEAGAVVLEASQDEGKSFIRIGQPALPKNPTAIRVGKVGKGGRGADYPKAAGEPVRCHIQGVIVRGPEPEGKALTRAVLPEIDVHYEIYDGLPLISKWLVVRNTTAKTIRVNSFVSEELRLAEVESTVEHTPDRERPNLWVETDYAFGGMDAAHAMNKSVHLEIDPDYPTQVNYDRKTACLLRCKPPLGPDGDVRPGETLESFRTYELLLDSTDRERRGLAQRRMYRTIAPWTAENPLMFHVRSADEKTIRMAIDQASEVGFELLIMSFGSGFNLESTSPEYQRRYKKLALEAKEKKLALGGYSLLASRGAGDPKDNTQGQRPTYGVMPCLGAKWGRAYLEQVKSFIKEADLGVLEHDGSYPGDCCVSTSHPFHHGLDDSQWVQWQAITDLYKWCRSEGVYLNVPDWYFLSGANKCGMGYRESNWSLPRAEQELIERQNIFDGTWTKTGSMGWMFVPLTEYHGGGAAATIEPLNKHLDHYEARLANLLGAGVQACYRGPRLFDTDDTKAVVKKWVAFYKTHREVLDADLIHLRRANGRDWDGWLHVNPSGKEKGLAFIYNPLPEPIERNIRVPLHYTGLTESALVSINGAEAAPVRLDRDESVTLPVTIPANGRTWLLFTRPGIK